MNISPSTTVIGLIVIVILLIIVSKLGKALGRFILALGALAVTGLGLATLLVQADASRQAAQAATAAATGQTAISAAMSIIVFLLVIIVALVVAAVSTVVGWQWWKRYQKRQKMRDVLEQAQLYALLQGTRLPSPRSTAGALPQQPGSNILVFPGGQQAAPGVSLEDLAAALQAAQGRPNPSLLPPLEDNRWEVLE